MKGFISVTLPTKKYIKAYIHHQLGAQPVMSRTNHIGTKLYDLLEHTTNERPFVTNNAYDASITIYIGISAFTQRGHNINGTNVRNFNGYLEQHIKQQYRTMMDFYMSVFPNFTTNLDVVREHIGIGVEDWDSDSLKKDYYRYRKRSGRPMLYKRPVRYNDAGF